jgi:hypothetical protein
MAEVSIKEQTEHLIQLQAIDTQIYSLRRRLSDIPVELENKDKEFEAKKAVLNGLEEKTKGLLVKRKEKELELSTKEENVKKLQIQLYQIKTNKEYTAMVKEIEGLKADNSRIEDDILNIMMELDELKVEIEKEKANLSEEEKKINAEKKTLEEEQKTIEQQLDTLNHKRAQVTSQIDPKILNTYERILKNKDGLALVKVVNNACQGCFMNVPPQVVNEIRMYERIVTCGICSRILYEEDIT